MQIGFYAPLGSPGDASPTNDRNPARFLMDALARTGHAVELVSTFSSHDEKGELDAGARLRRQALRNRKAERLRRPRPVLKRIYYCGFCAPLPPLSCVRCCSWRAFIAFIADWQSCESSL